VRAGRVRLIALASAVAFAIGISGCGVPTSGSPHAISKSELPAAPPPATTTTTPNSDDVEVTIVLLNAVTSAPIPVHRFVALRDDSLRTILSDLLSGPQPGETLQGLTSAIPTTTQLINLSSNPLGTPGVAPSAPVTVDLSTDFIEINGPDVVLAVEQVVFTIGCDLTPSTRVLFEVEGVPQDVPIASGTSVSRPVSTADYLPAGTALNCAVSLSD
jgi:spore germination protein GerM